MRRLQAGVLVLLATTLAASGAAPPPLPRNLTEQEQKEVDTLHAWMERHVMAGEFEQAVQPLEQVAALRAQRQGARHWQVIDARFAVPYWRLLTKVPEGD